MLVLSRVLAVSFVSMFAHTAFAQSSSVELRYQAPAACPDRGTFSDEVAARLGYVPFALVASDWVRVTIVQDGATWLGTIERSDGSARVVRANDCSELVRITSTALAVQLDSRAAPVPAPTQPATPSPAVYGTPVMPPTQQQLGPTVPVRVVANDPQVSLYDVSAMQVIVAPTGYWTQSGGQTYARLCAGDCTLQLSAGEHRFGVSATSSTPVFVLDEITPITGPSELRVEYVSRWPVRLAGLVIMVAGLVVGLPVALVPSIQDAIGHDVAMGLGLGIATGFTIGGSIMLFFVRDKVSVEVAPLQVQ